MTQSAAPTPEVARPRRAVIVWDLVTSLILLILGFIILGLTFIASFMLPLVSDPCGGDIRCNYSQFGTGYLVALIAPIVIFLVAIVLTIIRLVRRRIAFWVALVGLLLALAGWALGVALVFGSVPGSMS